MTTYHDYIESDGTTVITRDQGDISTLLDMNKAFQNEPDAWKQGVKNSWALYGRIPNIIQEKWLLEHGVNVWDKENWEKGGRVWKLLNDPEYRWLKTTCKYHAG